MLVLIPVYCVDLPLLAKRQGAKAGSNDCRLYIPSPFWKICAANALEKYSSPTICCKLKLVDASNIIAIEELTNI